MHNHGLNDSQVEEIQSIVAAFAPPIEKVALFGSRAKGDFKANSDIDIVLYGDVNEKIVDRLWTQCNESNLPYKVDVIAYRLIDYPPLQEHVDRVAKTLIVFEAAQVVLQKKTIECDLPDGWEDRL